MNYERRDAVVTKVWRAVRDTPKGPNFLNLTNAMAREFLRIAVKDSLQSIEPDSNVSILSCIDGVVRLKWTGSDEIIRIQRTEGVMEVRVGF